jgi:kynurenine formamidase
LSDVLSGGRNCIAQLAQKGIVTRGVVLDLESVARERDESYSPGTSFSFTVDDLERARANAEITYRQGDIIVLRTGFLRWYRSLPAPDRERISHPRELRACGLEHTERMAEYLWNSHAAAVAADCPSLEVWPQDYSEAGFPFGALHRILLGQFGMWIGELWELDNLADRCAQIGRHEVLIASAPLHVEGGVSSPANALAII